MLNYLLPPMTYWTSSLAPRASRCRAPPPLLLYVSNAIPMLPSLRYCWNMCTYSDLYQCPLAMPQCSIMLCCWFPLQGMLLAYSISNLVRTLLSLHSALGKPMSKSGVHAICKLTELLKCIQYTYHRRAMLVADYVGHIVNYYELQLLHHLDMNSVSACVQVLA